MQLLWLLPSLGFGLFLGFVSGQWMMAGFACFTFLLLAIGMLVRQNREPLRESDPITISDGRVSIGFRKLSRASWLWPHEVRNRVTQAVLEQNRMQVANLRAKTKSIGNLGVHPVENSLRFFAGFSGFSELVLDLVKEGPHAFISGPTGSGKSQFLKLMLHSLTETYSAHELELVTLDFKGGATLAKFDDRSTLTTTDLDSNHQQVFDYLSDQLRFRENKLRELGLARIEDAHDIPRILIAIDELAALLQVRGAQEIIEAVAARGRSLGMHLVATAQSTSGIARSLLVNLGLRFAVGKVDALELAQLGFKAPNLAHTPLANMLRAQVLLEAATVNFAFPIPHDMKLGQEIYLGNKNSQTNPRILH